ncbi:type VI secretion system lipoprotein TssJ [Moellerella wisconsensis]|uniref:Type VI secretion system lipoprotein TssJ n=2 Tax=Moellerella wisconsensis TaxID=158849 RepID=A0A9Q8PYZ1_9GAMM|nr:type VI secretion system lipoprotein TssJ [Moellerella wisconsensis]UNH23318.1 type VI secretion system lipoprotein TssJ [Moellerella wisconsensis]UNH29814.1 type VI secretion system lipoprotein TssJ [Moellerella wisconsensis]UNH38039.1 type VI secretion system lipoprotein TssJ [Moellerella wisconsensis]UNH41505.1 type VI secretion system lipoprotein TssJ [Moellerella wisconsensis]WJW81001.1 type VI secretion system lipoprotein TssJ [Moellerella wisconsensis]
MIKKIKIIIILLVSGLFISSCSLIDLFRTGGILLVSIRAEDNINPTINNQPAPVTLRIYQLKDNVIFDERNFIELYHKDDDLLKNDLLSKRIIPSIYPSSEKEITLPLIEGTQYIAIIVEFSNYRSSANKKKVRLYSSKGARVAIHLDGTVVSIKN